MEDRPDVLPAGVAQALYHHRDEGSDTGSNTDHREIAIEDVEETDLGVLTAGDEEPEIEPETENNDRQQKGCQHQDKDVTRICAGNKQLGSI